jgi:TetR/AcrR family tetracycline transcriptional repressor
MGDAANADEFLPQLKDYFASLPPDQFPNFVALAGVLVEGDADERFEFGLDVLITGLAAVAARTT